MVGLGRTNGTCAIERQFLRHVGWKQPESAVWGKGPDEAKVPVVESGYDIGAAFPCEHGVHSVGQPDGRVVLQNRVSGKQERADRGYLPTACRHPASDIPNDGPRGGWSFASSDKVVEFSEDTR